MVGNSWQVKKKQKQTASLFVPPLEAPGAPQFKNHWSSTHPEGGWAAEVASKDDESNDVGARGYTNPKPSKNETLIPEKHHTIHVGGRWGTVN